MFTSVYYGLLIFQMSIFSSLWLHVVEAWTDSLVAVKHQLRFLGYLPHPHWAIPSSCGHATLAAQAVQTRDGVLMTESAAKQKLL